jgi:hypothetical protein
MNKNWTELYWRLMLAENFEDAILLKLKNFPKSFFKYRQLNERTIDNIQNNYIWLAEINSLNDPFECSIQFDNNECLRKYYSSIDFYNFFKKLTGQSLTNQDIKRLKHSQEPFLEYKKICNNKKIPFNLSPEEQLNKVQKRWAEIVDETNRNLRICSFSLTKNSLLLWSHYSNEHKGICIEYDLIDDESIRAFMQPVIYSDKVHQIDLFEEYTLMQMIGSSLIKSTDWEYEQEWRLTIFKQKDNFPQKMATPKPIAIYLGTRFYSNNEELKHKLFDIANECKIPVYQMQKHPNEFKLIEAAKVNC